MNTTVASIKALFTTAVPVTSVAEELAPFQTVADNLRSVISAKAVDITASQKTIEGAEAYLADVKEKGNATISAAEAESKTATAVLAKLEDMLGSM